MVNVIPLFYESMEWNMTGKYIVHVGDEKVGAISELLQCEAQAGGHYLLPALFGDNCRKGKELTLVVVRRKSKSIQKLFRSP